MTLLREVEQAEALVGVRRDPALAMLRQVWEQPYELTEGPVRWREMKEIIPSAERIASLYDEEARFSSKRSVMWIGYKVHLSETCEADLPSLITHVETTPATIDAGEALPDIHKALSEQARLPSMHLVDGGYGSAEQLVTSRTQYGVDLVCPVPPDNSWQGGAPHQDPDSSSSGNPHEAMNFGREEHVEHATRYRRAREFFDVVTGLWDSWADDAFIRDVDTGVYFDPDKLHVLDHKGEFLQVRGPLNVGRPIQGWPVIVQAGASEAGRQLAAETAEAIFAAGNNLTAVRSFYADVKGRMEKLERSPDHL